MVVGVMAVFYLGINVVRFILDGELREILGRRQLESRINKLQDHFIICGFGRMGSSLAEALERRGAPFVIIDRSEEALAEADRLDFLHIQGDSMSDEVLEAAHIGRARGIATCLPEDADNVYVTLTARALAPRLTIVAKANYEDTHAKLVRAGANHVLSPNKLAADRAMTKFMLPAVDDLIEFVVHGRDLEVSKVSLAHFPGAVGHSLSELALPARASVIVVAVVDEHGRRTFNPPPDTRLQAGDELIVIGAAGAMERMVELFGEKETA
jgi:voltage-gated potassium channel